MFMDKSMPWVLRFIHVVLHIMTQFNKARLDKTVSDEGMTVIVRCWLIALLFILLPSLFFAVKSRFNTTRFMSEALMFVGFTIVLYQHYGVFSNFGGSAYFMLQVGISHFFYCVAVSLHQTKNVLLFSSLFGTSSYVLSGLFPLAIYLLTPFQRTFGFMPYFLCFAGDVIGVVVSGLSSIFGVFSAHYEDIMS